MSPTERAKLDYNVTSHIAALGLVMWMAGSWSDIWFGWLIDPSVAIVGRAIFVLVGPVVIINVIRILYHSTGK